MLYTPPTPNLPDNAGVDKTPKGTRPALSLFVWLFTATLAAGYVWMEVAYVSGLSELRTADPTGYRLIFTFVLGSPLVILVIGLILLVKTSRARICPRVCLLFGAMDLTGFALLLTLVGDSLRQL